MGTHSARPTAQEDSQRRRDAQNAWLTHRPQRFLTFDAVAGEFCAALRWIYETCERLGAAESECLPLQLAVEKICTDLIAYGYGGRGGPIAIGIARLSGDPLGEDRLGGIPARAIWW